MEEPHGSRPSFSSLQTTLSPASTHSSVNTSTTTTTAAAAAAAAAAGTSTISTGGALQRPSPATFALPPSQDGTAPNSVTLPRSARHHPSTAGSFKLNECAGRTTNSGIMSQNDIGEIVSTTTAANGTQGKTRAAADKVSNVPTSSSRHMDGPFRNSGGSEDDMTDTDEGVMTRLAEFTDMAKRTAVQNEELSRELSDEKRRATHTSRKLQQCRSTCEELRESLTLAQDTVIKLREHELRWAESTTSEMSLRAEICAMKDEHAAAVSDAAILKKRCDALQRENTELSERYASIAEEKRQVEARARRLLRSDRYRGF